MKKNIQCVISVLPAILLVIYAPEKEKANVPKSM